MVFLFRVWGLWFRVQGLIRVLARFAGWFYGFHIRVLGKGKLVLTCRQRESRP